MFSALSYYMYLYYSEGLNQSGSNLNFQQAIHEYPVVIECFDVPSFLLICEKMAGYLAAIKYIVVLKDKRQPDCPPSVFAPLCCVSKNRARSHRDL